MFPKEINKKMKKSQQMYKEIERRKNTKTLKQVSLDEIETQFKNMLNLTMTMKWKRIYGWTNQNIGRNMGKVNGQKKKQRDVTDQKAV